MEQRTIVEGNVLFTKGGSRQAKTRVPHTEASHVYAVLYSDKKAVNLENRYFALKVIGTDNIFLFLFFMRETKSREDY